MFPPAGNKLAPSASRPRIVPIPVNTPAPLYVTSSRKVHRSSDGIINIIQELSFYTDNESGVKSLAGKQLKEIHAHPQNKHHGRFSAETNCRVFVGERMIRMHIVTAITPNSSDSLEIDELLHYAEEENVAHLPIAFEITLEPGNDEYAVEFDLSSPVVVALKQRITKSEGESYKIVQAIELRANESEIRPTQELVRTSTISHPTADHARFRERIFAGTDVIRIDRDIVFVCDRPVLALSERREYAPALPPLPSRRRLRRSSSVANSSTSSVPRRVSFAESKSTSKSKSATRSTTSTSKLSTAVSDYRTAVSPYSLHEDNNSIKPSPCTARNKSPNSTHLPSERTSRPQKKKWTVNSVVAKDGADRHEIEDRARAMRSLSTARNLSISPVINNGSSQVVAPSAPTPHGETIAVTELPVAADMELGPHGECTPFGIPNEPAPLVATDSLIRTGCGHSPVLGSPRPTSGVSTANDIDARSETTHPFECTGMQTPPLSPARLYGELETGRTATTSVATGRERSISRTPAKPLNLMETQLMKNRSLFGYGTRPPTAPQSNVVSSRSLSPSTQVSPLNTARPVTPKSRSNSTSQKEKQDAIKSSRKKTPSPQSPSLATATGHSASRNLFGSKPSGTPKDKSSRTPKKSDLKTIRDLHSPSVATARATTPKVGNAAESAVTESPMSTARLNTNRSGCCVTARDQSPMTYTSRAPSVSPMKTARRLEKNDQSARTGRAASQSPMRTAVRLDSQENMRTARESRENKDPSLRTGRPTSQSPLRTAAALDSQENMQTAREGRDSSARTARAVSQSPMRTAVRLDSQENTRTAIEAHGEYATLSKSPMVCTAWSKDPTFNQASTARALSQSPCRTARGVTPAKSPMVHTARPTENQRTSRAPSQSPYRTARGATPAKSPMVHTARPTENQRTSRAPSQSPYRTARGATPAKSPVMHTSRAASQSPYRTARGVEWSGSPSQSPMLRTARKDTSATRVCTYERECEEHALSTARAVSPYPGRQGRISSRVTSETGHEPTSRDSSVVTGRPQSVYDSDCPSPYPTSVTGTTGTTRTSSDSSLHTGCARTPQPPSSTLRTARAKSNARTPRDSSTNSGYEHSNLRTARSVSNVTTARALSVPRHPQFSAEECTSSECKTYLATARDAQSIYDRDNVSVRTGRARTPKPALTPTNLKTARAKDCSSPYPTSVTGTTGTTRTSSDLSLHTGCARTPQPLSPTQRTSVNSTPRVYTARDSSTITTARALSVPLHPQFSAEECTSSECKTYLATARDTQSIYDRGNVSVRTGRARTPKPAVTPTNLKTARGHGTPREIDTMPQGVQNANEYSEPAQFTYIQTPTGYLQKDTRPSPTRSARSPISTARDIRSYLQTAKDVKSRTPATCTAVSPAGLSCSLMTGCQRTPILRKKVRDISPQHSDELKTARRKVITPSKPHSDMRTARANPKTPTSATRTAKSQQKSARVLTAKSPDVPSSLDVQELLDEVTAPALSPENSVTSANDVKPSCRVKTKQANGKIHVEMFLSLKMNTTGSIRLSAQMAPQLQPKSVTVNGMQIWSEPSELRQ